LTPVVVLAAAWSTVGSIAAVIAAGAALVTVWFARRTVMEARAGRQEAHEAHADEMRQQAELLATTTSAHEREMAERERVFASELVLQRHAQLGRITDLLRRLADIARDEMVENPPLLEGTPFRLTRLTGVMAQLRAALAIFDALSGPALNQTEKLIHGYHAGTRASEVLGVAMNEAFSEVNSVAENHPSLRVPNPQACDG
jgi:hypothetical protein